MVSKNTTRKPYFEKTPLLANHRLVLKEINLTDVSSIIEICVYNGVFATNEAEAIDTLKQINVDVANGDSIHWGIFLTDTNELVGTCGYYRGYAENSGEIGYLLNSSHRGRGIMKEAVKLIVAFGFDTLKLNSVVAYTSPKNPASIAVLQNAGFSSAGKTGSDCELKFEQYNR